MKAKTIFTNRIEKIHACSIATAELLTKALHREHLLEVNRAVRFNPIMLEFEIVNSNYLDTGELDEDLYEYLGGILELKKRFNL